MSYQSEVVLRALDALLQANLAAAVVAVQAGWTAEDPVTLPAPVTYHMGYRADLLDYASNAFPYIVTMVPLREPRQPGRPRIESVVHIGEIQAFVVGSTQTVVTKVCHRYAQAIVAVLQTSHAIGGFVQQHREPRVQLTEVARHLIAGISGDEYNPSDVDYIRMARIGVELEGE